MVETAMEALPLQVIYTLFYVSNTSISNTRLKLTKYQVKAKQHPETELLTFENYSHSSTMLYKPRIVGHILKDKQKNKCVCIHDIIRLIIMKMKMKTNKRSHRYDINIPRSRHGHKYGKYKKCLSIMMLPGIKQHLSNM